MTFVFKLGVVKTIASKNGMIRLTEFCAKPEPASGPFADRKVAAAVIVTMRQTAAIIANPQINAVCLDIIATPLKIALSNVISALAVYIT